MPPFLEPEQFTFAARLESDWEAIRDEYLALPNGDFSPWIQGMMHDGGWTVYGLFALGRPIPGAAGQCPRTLAALASVPGLSMAGFSRLAPKTHVAAHVGWAASMYRLHFGLVVPPLCHIRVGAETRVWNEGKCLIFDDTIEHEARNDSQQTRAVLMLDFIRPGYAGAVEDHVPDEVRRYAQTLFRPGSGPATPSRL